MFKLLTEDTQFSLDQPFSIFKDSIDTVWRCPPPCWRTFWSETEIQIRLKLVKDKTEESKISPK